MLVRSVVFTVLMFISVLPWSIVMVIGRLGGYPVAYALLIVWTRAAFWLLQHLCGLNYRVEGSEHIPTHKAVVLLKHSSAYETLAQFLLFPGYQCWVLKREILWAPFLGWAVAAIRPIAIDRGAGHHAVAQVLAKGKARLDEGHWVLVFPEGTRMPPGETRRYGLSGVLLAQEAGRLLVPVAHNAGDYWPRRGWRKRPGTVTFRIGAPVDPAGRDPRQVNAEVQAWIEGQVAELRASGDRR